MITQPPQKVSLSYQDRASDIFGMMGDTILDCSTVREKDNADGN